MRSGSLTPRAARQPGPGRPPTRGGRGRRDARRPYGTGRDGGHDRGRLPDRVSRRPAGPWPTGSGSRTPRSACARWRGRPSTRSGFRTWRPGSPSCSGRSRTRSARPTRPPGARWSRRCRPTWLSRTRAASRPWPRRPAPPVSVALPGVTVAAGQPGVAVADVAPGTVVLAVGRVGPVPGGGTMGPTVTVGQSGVAARDEASDAGGGAGWLTFWWSGRTFRCPPRSGGGGADRPHDGDAHGEGARRHHDHPRPRAPVRPAFYLHVEQASQVGVWAYRFEGTGAAAGVSEGTFDIVPFKALTGVPGYTYDLATDVGKVRLYIDDHDFSVVDAQTPAEQRSALFDDAEVAVFIASGSAYKGASRALTAMANSRSLLVRVRRIGDTTVDYGDLRADLRRPRRRTTTSRTSPTTGPPCPRTATPRSRGPSSPPARSWSGRPSGRSPRCPSRASARGTSRRSRRRPGSGPRPPTRGCPTP